MVKQYKDTKTPVEIRDCWQTPKFVFDYYDNIYNFGCDLAASDTNHLCEHYFTEPDPITGEGGALNATADDGCFTLHDGAVFCNPPYSDIMPWVDCCLRLSRETGKIFVMLVPADTSVKWFKKAWDNCSECHFISGRLAFINADTGKPVAGNNKGSVVFVFDPLNKEERAVTLINREGMKCDTTP